MDLSERSYVLLTSILYYINCMMLELHYNNMLLCEKKSTLFFFKLDNVELRWVNPCAVLVCKTELCISARTGCKI